MAQSQHDNVDHAEIAKFDALASRWWDREGDFKPLHDINPLRLGFIDRHVALAGKRVLDVGCGGGILSEAMAQRGADVVGIDLGEAPLAVARLHQQESGVEVDYRHASVESRPIRASSTSSPASKCSSTCPIRAPWWKPAPSW